MRILWLAPLLLLSGALWNATASDEARTKPRATPKDRTPVSEPQKFLRSLQGKWKGTCRTWLKPGELADESSVRGEFQPLLEGRLLRHRYEGEFEDKPRRGEETIAFNPGEGRYQISWFDSFHMSYGLLFSEGEASEQGFTVRGRYRVRPGAETWGWKTVFTLTDADHLTITAYNVTPAGREGKAVETVYERVQ